MIFVILKIVNVFGILPVVLYSSPFRVKNPNSHFCNVQRINELRPTHTEFERDYYESLLIVLDTLERCLSSQVSFGYSQSDVYHPRLVLDTLERCLSSQVSFGHSQSDVYHPRLVFSTLERQVSFRYSREMFIIPGQFWILQRDVYHLRLVLDTQ